MTRNLELQFFVLSLFIVKDDFEFYTFLIETFGSYGSILFTFITLHSFFLFF